MLLKACLNGSRSRADHAACPVTPAELASAARSVVSEGAGALHIHPRDEQGNESLRAAEVAATLDAVREFVTQPVGISTGAWLLPDPGDRLSAISQWHVLPDFASVNFHEAGALDVARALLALDVGVEAGIWNRDAAELLVRSGLGPQCLRILIEPMEHPLERALANVREIEDRLDGTAVDVPRLLHGVDRTAWSVLEYAGAHGYDARMGLEDALTLPTGALAVDNAELVRTAASRLHL